MVRADHGEVGPDGQVWVIDWYNYIVTAQPDAARL
jgi:RIO-like serine/threonine protein kinase